MNFQIHALPPEVLERVRASRVDVSGTPIEQVTAEAQQLLQVIEAYEAERGELARDAKSLIGQVFT